MISTARGNFIYDIIADNDEVDDSFYNWILHWAVIRGKLKLVRDLIEGNYADDIEDALDTAEEHNARNFNSETQQIENYLRTLVQ